MNISIIIVSWKVKDKLKNNLQALYQSSGDIKFEVFVVDNNSGDGTVEMMRQEFPQVKLIINNDNLGFAKANNLAIKTLRQAQGGQARGDFVLLLNPDMRVAPDTLNNLLAWLKKNPQATITGCKLVDEQGEVIPQVRRFPTAGDQFYVASKLGRLMPRLLNKYLCRNFDYDQAAQVDSIRGSFFCVRRTALEKIGLLDERFFIWFEEVDYCRRAKELGLQVWYTPAASCVDLVGQSFTQVGRGQKQKYFKQSMIKYFQKWGKPFDVLVLRIGWAIGDGIARIIKN